MLAMISTSDLIALGLYSLVLLGIGVWGFRKVTSSSDFYLAGGKVPWWLSGVSHHVSGYSAVVFTGYAAIAYETEGFINYFLCPAPFDIGIEKVIKKRITELIHA